MTPDDELTQEGFLQLHLMAVEDEEGGGEEDLRDTLSALGYNRQLVLDQVDVHAQYVAKNSLRTVVVETGGVPPV